VRRYPVNGRRHREPRVRLFHWLFLKVAGFHNGGRDVKILRGNRPAAY
jgi:hypothetical protein